MSGFTDPDMGFRDTQTPNVVIESPRTRNIAYKVTAWLGLALGATQVGFLSAQATQPLWLTVALGVYGFVAMGIGFTAASNTPR